ncbi:hypothetical protein Q5P01_005757 [Channa striata]|uniref:Uncharacterized protein n=1 Tax=Channa striata TaxID=64152 RepID=A0AA88T7N2_CHASR|nr:hypothetical protein Q5P01_005757 [Channa striata]
MRGLLRLNGAELRGGGGGGGGGEPEPAAAADPSSVSSSGPDTWARGQKPKGDDESPVRDELPLDEAWTWTCRRSELI